MNCSRQNQQNGTSAQRRFRSAWAFAQSDQSSLSAWTKLGSLATHWAHSEDYQTVSLLGTLSFCWFSYEAAQMRSWWFLLINVKINSLISEYYSFVKNAFWFSLESLQWMMEFSWSAITWKNEWRWMTAKYLLQIGRLNYIFVNLSVNLKLTYSADGWVILVPAPLDPTLNRVSTSVSRLCTWKSMAQNL